MWATEPTRIRGEQGQERRVGIGQNRAIENEDDQKNTKARLSAPLALDDKVFRGFAAFLESWHKCTRTSIVF